MKLNIVKKKDALDSRVYLCQSCDRIFRAGESEPACPKCGVEYDGNVVTVYIEPDLIQEQMFTAADFMAGD